MIPTLTLWRFWARTRVRQHLWSRTTINGEPLEYTGSGWELFKSFLFVIFAVILPIYLALIAVVVVVMLVFQEAGALLLLLLYFGFLLGVFWLVGLAVYLAQRYRLSRTSWRGVRFGLPGSAKEYARAFLGYSLLSFITMGWATPMMETRLARRTWGGAVYGDKSFGFTSPDGKGLAAGLYLPFALAWFGSILGLICSGFVFVGVYTAMGGDFDRLTTGAEYFSAVYTALAAYLFISVVFSFAYYAALMRRVVSCITIDGVRFSHTASTLGLFWLYLGNALVVAFTFGIGLPFTHVRTMRFVVHRLKAEGKVDLATIGQNPDAGPKMGEGLADAFDLGTI